ncbi:hypothetical protein KEM52_001941 [Ascosphaera acerosa]|nr:hypothetical protein KEM52_001941 [Ascosphaera acerosa]
MPPGQLLTEWRRNSCDVVDRALAFKRRCVSCPVRVAAPTPQPPCAGADADAPLTLAFSRDLASPPSNAGGNGTLTCPVSFPAASAQAAAGPRTGSGSGLPPASTPPPITDRRSSLPLLDRGRRRSINLAGIPRLLARPVPTPASALSPVAAPPSNDTTRPTKAKKHKKRKRSITRSIFSFSKGSSSTRSRESGHSLVSLNSETGVGDILQQQLGKASPGPGGGGSSSAGSNASSGGSSGTSPTRRGAFSLPFRRSAGHGDGVGSSGGDYFVARAANPRTGVVSPGRGSKASTSEDQAQASPPKRKPSIVQRWRQRGDQWVSVGVEHALSPPSPSSSPPPPPPDAASAITPLVKRPGFLKRKAVRRPAAIELGTGDISATASEPTPGSEASAPGLPSQSHPAATSQAAIATRERPRSPFGACSWHWGDAAVPDSGLGGAHPESIGTGFSLAAAGLHAHTVPAQSGTTAPESGPVRPRTVSPVAAALLESKLSRVTELSEPDATNSSKRAQAVDAGGAAAPSSDPRTPPVSSDTVSAHANRSAAATRSAALIYARYARYDAHRESINALQRAARAHHVVGKAQLKRKPLATGKTESTSVPAWSLKAHPHSKPKSPSTALRGESHRRNAWSSKRARSSSQRTMTRRSQFSSECRKLAHLRASAGLCLASPANLRSYHIGTTDGTCEVGQSVAGGRTRASTLSMQQEPSSPAGSSEETVRPSTYTEKMAAAASPSDATAAYGLPSHGDSVPMTAFVIATLLFVRDFVLDRKTFRFFALTFGYLLQMVSHTLSVALVLCNAVLISVRAASPRKGLAYLREMKYFGDDLYHALCYSLLLTFVFGAAWKLIEYLFSSLEMVFWVYQVAQRLVMST